MEEKRDSGILLRKTFKREVKQTGKGLLQGTWQAHMLSDIRSDKLSGHSKYRAGAAASWLLGPRPSYSLEQLPSFPWCQEFRRLQRAASHGRQIGRCSQPASAQRQSCVLREERSSDGREAVSVREKENDRK